RLEVGESHRDLVAIGFAELDCAVDHGRFPAVGMAIERAERVGLEAEEAGEQKEREYTLDSSRERKAAGDCRTPGRWRANGSPLTRAAFWSAAVLCRFSLNHGHLSGHYFADAQSQVYMECFCVRFWHPAGLYLWK